jgi:hypothetical protein
MFLSPAFRLLYECRAEAIITYTSSTPDACETHAKPVEKPIASPSSAEDHEPRTESFEQIAS